MGNSSFRKGQKPWRTISSRQLASVGEVKLHEDQIVSKSGLRTTHLRLSLHDFTVILPIADNGRIVFIWNYRHAIQGWELELPAGLVDDGEDPDACARRELREETGYSAGSLRKLGWVHTLPGITSQKAHVYLARKLKKGKAHPEPYERMKVKTLGLREAYGMLWSGKIVHSPTVSAMGLAQKTVLGER